MRVTARSRASLWLLCACALCRPASVRVGPVYSSAERVELQLELTAPAKPPSAGSVWLMEDGVKTVAATTLKPARETQRSLAVIIAVDVSGSMKGARSGDMQNGLRGHRADFAPGASVALVSFASDLKSDSD